MKRLHFASVCSDDGSGGPWFGYEIVFIAIRMHENSRNDAGNAASNARRKDAFDD
jgi:hypothetical protein